MGALFSQMSNVTQFLRRCTTPSSGWAVCVAFLFSLSSIPKLDKFCFMFDLYLSVKWTAVLLAAINVIYFIQALVWFVGGKMSTLYS